MSDKTRKPHRQICSLCHEVDRVSFLVPDDVWELAVHASQINSIICLRCFTRLADERGVRWDRDIQFFPVSWISQAEAVAAGAETVPAALEEREIDMPCPDARCPNCGGLLGLRPTCAHPDHEEL